MAFFFKFIIQNNTPEVKDFFDIFRRPEST